MFDFISFLFDEKEKKVDYPEYIKNEWPYLMVTLGKADEVEFQLQQNDIEYKGPTTDSYLTGGPALCELLYFENQEILKRAGFVVWKTENVKLEAIDKTGSGQVLNKKPEIYDFIDTNVDVKVV